MSNNEAEVQATSRYMRAKADAAAESTERSNAKPKSECADADWYCRAFHAHAAEPSVERAITTYRREETG